MRKLTLPLLLFLIITACNPWKYLGEYDRDTDFTKFKTFGLLHWDPQNDKEVSPETKEYLLMAIKDELEKRGYVLQKKDADLQVSVFILVSEETSYSAYANHYAGYPGYGHVAVGVGVGSGGTAVGAYGYGIQTYPYTTVNHDYTMGTVVIDLLDHSNKKLVWQGVATGKVAHEQASEGSVKTKVSRVFDTFPVKKQKNK